MNVLVISPFRKGKLLEAIVSNIENYEVINTAPLQLCSLLRKLGNNVVFIALQNIFRTFEQGKDEKRLKKILDDYPCDILIFHTDYYMNNTNTAAMYSMRVVGEIIKNNNPSTKIVYCGKLTEMLGEELLWRLNCIDIAIRGEAEPVIETVLNCDYITIEKKNIGCIYRENGEIKNISGINFISDYNELPLVNYEFMNSTISILEKEGKKIDSLPISIRTSYGCPYSCKFCCNTRDWHIYRVKNQKTLQAEISNLKRACNKRLSVVFIADELFTFDIEHIKEVVRVFEINQIMVNGLFSHANDISEEKVALLKKITRCIIMGAETHSDKILCSINKGLAFEQIIKAVQIIKSNGIHAGLEWIVGLPTMTYEDYLYDLNTIYRLISCGAIDFIEPYVFVPHPNTFYYNNHTKYKMKISDKYDEMLEEGGKSQVEYDSGLSRKQITLMYFVYKFVISEAQKAKGYVSDIKPCSVNLSDFIDYFEEFK